MNKKIGIITTHDVYNYGSSLQAYALQTYIEKCNLGIVKIIDYKPKYLYKLIDFLEVDSLKWRKNLFTRTIYCIYLIPFRLKLLKKYFKYKSFNKEYLKLTKKRYYRYDELKKINEFDVFVCGSDQIWNSTKSPCGEDSAFFLEFTDKLKVSYAASFGSNSITDLEKQLIIRNIPTFQKVSVREKSGQDILSKFNFDSELVLDPVFLLSKDEWESMSSDKMKEKKYIFVYGYDNSDKYYELINEISKNIKEDVMIIDASNYKFIRNAGPLEFIDLIKNASLVITTSFHAVAFSIILNTQFIACSTNNKSLFERIDNLLNLCGLQKRVYETVKDLNLISDTINYDEVNKKLKSVVKKSKDFLSDSLR